MKKLKLSVETGQVQAQNVEQCKAQLESKGVSVEAIRIDEYTSKRFVFFADPDGLPLELYESQVHIGG